METTIVNHDTTHSTKIPQLLSAPSGSIYRWTIITFSQRRVYCIYVYNMAVHTDITNRKKCRNTPCVRNQNSFYVASYSRLNFLNFGSFLTMLLAKKKKKLCTISEDSEGAGIVLPAQWLDYRLVNQENLLRFPTEAINSLYFLQIINHDNWVHPPSFGMGSGGILRIKWRKRQADHS